MMSRLLGKLTVWKVLFGILMALGLYATYVRFFHGLGAATNLSDRFPWGLWIGFDVLVGVGLAAGGFVIAATVHIFHMEKYEPIARPTILTAFLGYQLVVVALLYDIGHPYRLWHPLVMWNPHSVMFEVAWCVTLYSTVLALEFSPLIFERLGWERPLRWIRAIYMPLVIAGVLLSTLHQSSLGTLYVIAPDKLHGLWYTPLLPVFFFLSAIAGGLAMTIFESFLSFRAFGKRLETHLLEGLARAAVVVLAVYAVWKIQDLSGRGNLHLAFESTPESVLFWGEMGLGVLLPILLFAVPRIRRSEQGLFFGALLVIMGFVVNRLNVAITGMTRALQSDYFPTWMELSVTAMIVAIGFVCFALAVKWLPIFPGEASLAPEPRSRPAFHGGAIAGLWVFLAIGFLAVGYVLRTPKNGEPASPIQAEAAVPDVDVSSLKLPPAFVFPRGADSPGIVTFRHDGHMRQKGTSCGACHRETFRLLDAGKPLTGVLNQDRIHQGDLCQTCHDSQRAFGTDECDRCHKS